MSFFWMHNATIGADRQFPDEEGVREYWEARGWVVTDPPHNEVSVPTPVNNPPGDTTFIRMYHPGADAWHDFPNNADAISGALSVGWVYEKPAPVTVSTKVADKKSDKSESESK